MPEYLSWSKVIRCVSNGLLLGYRQEYLDGVSRKDVGASYEYEEHGFKAGHTGIMFLLHYKDRSIGLYL